MAPPPALLLSLSQAHAVYCSRITYIGVMLTAGLTLRGVVPPDAFSFHKAIVHMHKQILSRTVIMETELMKCPVCLAVTGT